MKRRTKGAQSKGSKRSIVQKRTPAKLKRGVTQAPAKLDRIVKLVNMVGPDDYLPVGAVSLVSRAYDAESVKPSELELEHSARENLIALISDLPFEALRNHLRECMAHPDLVGPNLGKYQAPVVRYAQIRSWRDTLLKIAKRERFIAITTTTEFDYETGKSRDLKDDLMLALDETDFRNIQQCKACRKIYFASRLTYKGKRLRHCSPDCRKALRRKQYRYPVKQPPKPDPRWLGIDSSIRTLSILKKGENKK